MGGGENLYSFAPNVNVWVDPLGLSVQSESAQRGIAKATEYLKSKGFKILSDEVTIKVLDRTGKKWKKVRIRPDIVAMKDGKIYFIEEKNNTGRLTKGQKKSGLFNLKKRTMLEENFRRLHIWFQQKIRISKRM